MELFIINTTAYAEEDLHLISDASFKEIEGILTDVISKERRDDLFHTNEEYVDYLQKGLPHRTFYHVVEPTYMTI
jgi:hypothetical protein